MDLVTDWSRRLDMLEQSNRTLRRAAVLFAVAFVVLAVFLGWKLRGTVEATTFVVRDANGKVAARLSRSAEGRPSLLLIGGEGETGLCMTLGTDGITFVSVNGMLSLELPDDDGPPQLEYLSIKRKTTTRALWSAPAPVK